MLCEMFDEGDDLVCRYGGEEFLVFLNHCPKKKAKELAEEFREKVEATPVVLRRKKTFMTASVGVASLSQEIRSVEELIQKADDDLFPVEGGQAGAQGMYSKNH